MSTIVQIARNPTNCSGAIFQRPRNPEIWFGKMFLYSYTDELDENDPKYTQDTQDNIELKPHQLTLLHKCLEHESSYLKKINNEMYENVRTNIGIIADKVGSGKSYVILSLIKHMVSSDYDSSDSLPQQYGNGHVIIERKRRLYNEKKMNVLVISHSLVKQWTLYVEQFSKNIKYFVINKNSSIKIFFEENKIDETELLIVTGSFYKNICRKLENTSNNIEILGKHQTTLVKTLKS